MALTTDIKVELARVETAKACCRCAEITAMLRFAGRVQVVRGHVVVEAEFDTRQAADRFAEAIRDAFNLQCEMIVIGPRSRRAIPGIFCGWCEVEPSLLD